jgi:hypothetical protein
MKVFAIKDLKSNLFYQQKPTTNGWYDDISGVRLFKEKARAEATIKANEHHVSFPGNRKLKVVTISLIEITD